jgi:TolB protein
MRHRRLFLLSPLPILGVIVVLALSFTGCRPDNQELPSILFLRPDDAGLAQLFSLSAPDAAPQQLTKAESGPGLDLIDFAVSPDATTIVYSAFVDIGGTVIRQITGDGRDDQVILECPSDECSGIVWSPDGRRLVYERRALDEGGAGQPRLYWLDPETGETKPLIEGDTTPSFGASFSPDGDWLSYVSPSNDGIVLYQLADGRQRLIPSRVGRPAAWSPDSADIVIGDLIVTGRLVAPGGENAPETGQESSAVYLYRVTLEEEGSRERLSPEASIEDSVPAWSPGGRWIAFGRRPAETVTGRQLWLMRPDGGDARALTDEPSIFHGLPNWSPDGRWLLFQRYDLTDPTAIPSVWLMEVATGELRRVVENGYQPAWLIEL